MPPIASGPSNPRGPGRPQGSKNKETAGNVGRPRKDGQPPRKKATSASIFSLNYVHSIEKKNAGTLTIASTPTQVPASTAASKDLLASWLRHHPMSVANMAPVTTNTPESVSKSYL